MLRPLARDTLTKQATETIRQVILAEDNQPGAPFPSERELTESLAVSRNIVREALSVLVAEGLIVKQPGRGIFIANFDRSALLRQSNGSVDYNGYSLLALSEARAAVELGAIGLICARISEEQLQELERINSALEENLRNRRSTIKYDIEFHTVLFESTQNPVLMDMIPLLVEHFRLTISQKPSVILHNPERVVTEHQRIITALRARDQAAAHQALVDHLQQRASFTYRQSERHAGSDSGA